VSDLKMGDVKNPESVQHGPTLDGIKEARRQWDFVISRSNRTLMVWRTIAILSMASTAIAMWFAFDHISKPNMIPYVVTVDAGTGRVDFRGVVQPRALAVTDAVVRYHLLQFIRATRTVSTDQQITRQFLASAYVLATPQSQRQLTEAISGRENNPLQLSADGYRRDIDIELYEKTGDRLWRVEWVEEVRQGGQLIDRIGRTGTFSFITALPENEQEAEQNPYGFYIDEFYLATRR